MWCFVSIINFFNAKPKLFTYNENKIIEIKKIIQLPLLFGFLQATPPFQTGLKSLGSRGWHNAGFHKKSQQSLQESITYVKLYEVG